MRITGFEANFQPRGLTRIKIEGVVSKNEYCNIENAYTKGSTEFIGLTSGRDICPEFYSDIIGGRRNYSYYTFSDYSIKRVIFHDPATIVFWTDGSKTVVKTMPGDIYNPEVGLAMCISKKVLGDKYHHEFKKWLKEAENG